MTEPYAPRHAVPVLTIERTPPRKLRRRWRDQERRLAALTMDIEGTRLILGIAWHKLNELETKLILEAFRRHPDSMP